MVLSSDILKNFTNPDLCTLIDELQDFQKTGILKPGMVRELVQNDNKIINSSNCIEFVRNNIYQEAALRFRNELCDSHK